MPFIACEIYKNCVFAIDINEDIWRFDLEYVDQMVCIRKLTGNEQIVLLLRAKFNLYR